MTGEIILAGYGVVSLITTTICIWLGRCYRRPVKPKPTPGGLSQTEFERLMQAKHGDNWPSLIDAWSLGDE